MEIRYEESWNSQKFMEENGGFDKHLITDYLQCTELAYSQEDIEYLKGNGINDITPYVYEAMETKDW